MPVYVHLTAHTCKTSFYSTLTSYRHVVLVFSSEQSVIKYDDNVVSKWENFAYCNGDINLKMIHFTNMLNNSGSWSFYSRTMYVAPV